MVFLGIGGSGRASATKLAAFMSDYELFQIEITKTYTFTDWREDVKKMLRKAGFDGVSTVFLFGDHQLKVSIKGEVCVRAQWPIGRALISDFRNMKRLGVFLLPPGMIVRYRFTLSIKFPGWS